MEEVSDGVAYEQIGRHVPKAKGERAVQPARRWSRRKRWRKTWLEGRPAVLGSKGDGDGDGGEGGRRTSGG